VLEGFIDWYDTVLWQQSHMNAPVDQTE